MGKDPDGAAGPPKINVGASSFAASVRSKLPAMPSGHALSVESVHFSAYARGSLNALTQHMLYTTGLTDGLAGWQAGQDDDPVLEEALGFGLFSQGQAKLGWLMNLNEVCAVVHVNLQQCGRLSVDGHC